MVVLGKTNLRGFPSSLRLHPTRLTGAAPALRISIQSGYVKPFGTAVRFSAITSLMTIGLEDGEVIGVPAAPFCASLARQFAGASGSAKTSTICNEYPPPSGWVGQPFSSS